MMHTINNNDFYHSAFSNLMCDLYNSMVTPQAYLLKLMLTIAILQERKLRPRNRL